MRTRFLFMFAVSLSLTAAWMFSGYPVVWDDPGIPPMVNEAKMAEVPSLTVGSDTYRFGYTDDISGEDLIIRSDQKTYVGFTGVLVRFSITNTGKKTQSMDLRAYVKDPDAKVKEISQWNGEAWTPLTLTAGTASDRPGVFRRIVNRIERSFGAIAPKFVPGSYRVDQRTNAIIDPGQTLYFQMDLQTPKGATGEFYLEVMGDKGGYGLLDPWYSTLWLYRKQLTIDYTMVSSTSNLTDFDLLVSYTDTDLRSTANGGHVATGTGFDIMFTDSTGSGKLDHEIESYNSSTGAIVMWVRIPTLSYTADTNIYIYYGNSSVTASQENAPGVWDGSYLAVYHLKESPTGVVDEIKDSNNGYNGTSTNMTAANQQTGQIGGSIDFDGATEVINISKSASVKGCTQVTLSAWVFKGTVGGQDDIFEESINSGVTTRLKFQTNGTVFTLRARSNDGGGLTIMVTAATTTALINTWYHAVGIFDSVSDVHHFVVSGGDNTLSTAVLGMNVNNPFNFPAIGGRTGGQTGEYFDGLIDEFRISCSFRSLALLRTEYMNQYYQGTGAGKFIKTLGAEEGAALTQNNWRWYANADSVQPGSALAAEKTSSTTVLTGDILRLRVNLTDSVTTFGTSTQSFTLQYATGTDCASYSTWTNVCAVSANCPWRGFHNTSTTDGTAFTSTLLSDSNVIETYEESNPSVSNPKSFIPTQNGEWDWAIQNFSAPTGTSYCFRMTSDGPTMSYGATSYPQVLTSDPISIISITISTTGTVSYGYLPLGGTSSTIELNSSQIVKNSGNVTETFKVKGQNTGCPWTLSASAGNEQYKHEYSSTTGATWLPLTTGYQSLKTGVAVNATSSLDLRITVPTQTACTDQQSADVTILAEQG